MTTEPRAADTAQEGVWGKRSTLHVHPHLYVVLECDRPCAGGTRHSLADVDEVVVRRGAERGVERDTREKTGGVRRLVVTLPGRWLSSTHARLAQAAGRWV